MPIKKPKVLIVFTRQGTDTSTKFGGFVKRIQKNGGFGYADVDYVALEKLVFHIQDKDHAKIYDPIRDIDLSAYSFVYFKAWQSMPEYASSVAHFLEAQGIPYADLQVRHQYVGKTVNYMQMWAKGVAVPETIWGHKDVLINYVHDLADDRFPIIIKSVLGQKGEDNFLAKTKQEAVEILEQATVAMLLQQFIPNDGDYRIGVYGNQALWAIYRKSGGTSHLNNTSAGGEASLLAIDDVDESIRELAERAAAACELSISGVDVVQDKRNGELYVFEANQGSQIVTGAFTDTNMTAFDAGMKNMVSRRFKGGLKNGQPLTVIGRTVEAGLKTENGTVSIRAKVDSGAYQSAIDASDVELLKDAEGKEYVQYTLEGRGTDHKVTVTSYDFGRARIISSTGHTDVRFVVPMRVIIGGKEYNTRVTLAKRSNHKSQMLIGRQLLRGNFLINVELGL